jgi:hypothetical protein
VTSRKATGFDGSRNRQIGSADTIPAGSFVATGVAGVGFDAGGNKGVNFATPTNGTDAANMAWVLTQVMTVTIRVVEVDFGTAAHIEQRLTVSDALVLTNSKLPAWHVGGATTGSSADEGEMDDIMVLATGNGAGSVNLYLRGREGPVAGKKRIMYMIGA